MLFSTPHGMQQYGSVIYRVLGHISVLGQDSELQVTLGVSGLLHGDCHRCVSCCMQMDE